MKYFRQTGLHRELRGAGADDAELEALVPIAEQLKLLRKAPAAGQTGHSRQKTIKLAGFALSGLTAVVVLIVISQSVLPTSWLYPVQKASDNAAVALHPAYRANVMMKRARQVHELVVRRAGSAAVLATLADYAAEAGAYKTMPHTSYAAFEYCESNLHQAAVIATPSERKAIAQSLVSLQAT